MTSSSPGGYENLGVFGVMLQQIIPGMLEERCTFTTNASEWLEAVAGV